MRSESLTPIGARVTDLPVDTLTHRQVSWLRQVLADHGVAILHNQAADDNALLRFLRSFGTIQFTQGEVPVDGHPDLNVISNVGRTTAPKSTFHVDTSYVRIPPAYTALRAVTIPDQGGQTLFTNQYRAHDTLPESLRRKLVGRTITHRVTGVVLGDNDESSADHPALRRHPHSGRTSLYLSTPQRCTAISGLTAAQSAEMVALLHEHSTREDNVLRHRWAPGDVVIWDNRVVMHRADHSGVVGDRVMHRGMVSDARS